MSDAKPETPAERREFQRVGLSALGFDGPKPISFDVFMSVECAVCLTCGAMILLGDAAPSPHDPDTMIERGISLHWEWHHNIRNDIENQEQRP